ncbi:hypothetical protein M5D96_013528 [Drosophila gunungcola]|uniref:Uncharacterized protein n=1 Tax=Drosophila gunungcola TaxID=103775 RepID=A0A9P9YBN0_9MUSC|nr:hypothetical protein M5D96_013528 [Drosophila gunungcola]
MATKLTQPSHKLRTAFFFFLFLPVLSKVRTESSTSVDYFYIHNI